jgi:ABC-type bacteriocin/lantibiotic exporter with double-glycine peptidase domain
MTVLLSNQNAVIKSSLKQAYTFCFKVCLARVLLKQPSLLVLDEATANLDEKTEVLFQKVLEEKFQDATILCVAHRLDTLRWCRTKIEMGGGQLLSVSDFIPDEKLESNSFSQQQMKKLVVGPSR